MRRARPGVRRLAASVTGALTAAALAAGCGSGSATAGRQHHLTVLAAASLTDAFGAVVAGFERAHPGVSVDVSAAGSQELVAQVEQGVDADVIATADERQMQRLVSDHKLAGPPADFTTNRLEIAVRPGNPRHVAGLADLGRAGLVVVLAAPQVPAGGYARQALTAAGVTVHPASLETNVRSVLTKVELGEADAGVVYASDIASARGKVSGVAVAAADNVVAHYPIAVLAGGHSALARQFVGYVRSPTGQRVLRRFGFGAGGAGGDGGGGG